MGLKFKFSAQDRSVTGYKKLGGQVVMQRAATVRQRLLFLQTSGWAITHPALLPVMAPVMGVTGYQLLGGQAVM